MVSRIHRSDDLDLAMCTLYLLQSSHHKTGFSAHAIAMPPSLAEAHIQDCQASHHLFIFQLMSVSLSRPTRMFSSCDSKSMCCSSRTHLVTLVLGDLRQTCWPSSCRSRSMLAWYPARSTISLRSWWAFQYGEGELGPHHPCGA